MITIYGSSDDLVEIEGSCYEANEIDCYDKDVLIHFSDGTEIRVHYGKPNVGGVWQIVVEAQGSAKQSITVCEDENAEVYSDIFEIDAEIVRHRVVKPKKQ